VLIEKDICYSLLQLIGQKVLCWLGDFAAPSSDTNLIEHSEYISGIPKSFCFAQLRSDENSTVPDLRRAASVISLCFPEIFFGMRRAFALAYV
jgi:hypothetical protein